MGGEARPADESPVTMTDAEASSLRADLVQWTVDAVSQLVGDSAVRALDREQIVPARLAARREDTPVALLTRLFSVGDTLTRAQAERALPRLTVDGAQRCGLIVASGPGADAHVRAAVDLRPYTFSDPDGEHTWWVASDLGEIVTGSRLRDDHVLGIGGASATLASATTRAGVGRVLDLGTGCGIQALHASLHADAVVATDVSRRALAFAEFNRRLNAPPAAWEFRHGSLLEPVAGELFDLVVSNPPFVITPPGAPSFEYRDGGLRGDGIVHALVRDVGTVLAPGGVAHMLGNWEVRAGEDWRARVGKWLDEATVPLDAWIIQRDLLDAAEYAETWLRDAGVVPERERAGFEEAYEAYLTDFAARGVVAVGFGIVTLRRPPGGEPTLRRLEEHEGALPQPLGPHIGQVFAAHDWLASRSDDEVMSERWVVAPDVTRETYGKPTLDDPEHILIRQGGGLGRAIKADTALAGFVGACDGELTGAQIAGALAVLLEVDSAPMREGLAAAVRELARDGMLVRE
jgi:methylase of polypeptide subunit release factors